MSRDGGDTDNATRNSFFSFGFTSPCTLPEFGSLEEGEEEHPKNESVTMKSSVNM
ncbi:hypothetical protein BBR01nite_27300 [Brevibacillus brevis]|nr:hypothetical protein BBR01nite_27300 [Brevibacillus brevis]